LHCPATPLVLHPSPTRRSSDLGDVVLGHPFRTNGIFGAIGVLGSVPDIASVISCCPHDGIVGFCEGQIIYLLTFGSIKSKAVILDRKSTRLNSSHVKISYAVFC